MSLYGFIVYLYDESIDCARTLYPYIPVLAITVPSTREISFTPPLMPPLSGSALTRELCVRFVFVWPWVSTPHVSRLVVSLAISDVDTKVHALDPRTR